MNRRWQVLAYDAKGREHILTAHGKSRAQAAQDAAKHHEGITVVVAVPAQGRRP